MRIEDSSSYHFFSVGAAEKQQALAEAMRDFAPQARLTCLNFEAIRPTESEVRRADGAVCFDGNPNVAGPLLSLLRDLRAFDSSLPIVGVGISDTAAQARDAFTVQLNANADTRNVVSTMLRLARDRWWRGTNRIDTPAVAVDRQGNILQANSSAETRFGLALIGMPYATAVEEGRATALAPGHPILQVFQSGKGVTEYREFQLRNGEWYSAYLICTPILDYLENPDAVAILFQEEKPLPRFDEAVRLLWDAWNFEKLFDAIVQGAQILGFKRARLKQFDFKENKLIGRAAVGFSEPNLNEKYKGFPIDVSEDIWSIEALKYELPLLFIFDETIAAADLRRQRASIIRDCNRRLHVEELEKAEVVRWIDAPILLPTTDPSRREKWGILTVDRGSNSEKLSVSDAAWVMSFAQVAAMQISKINNPLQHEAGLIGVSRKEHTSALANLLQSNPNQRILPDVVGILLEAFLRDTPADVAYYREFQGNALVLIAQRWRKKDPNHEIPQRIERGRRFSARLLEEVEENGQIRSGKTLQNFFLNDTEEETELTLREQAQKGSIGWSPEEVAVLRYGSAAYVPLVLRNRFRGVIIALSKKGNGFPPDYRYFVERFRALAEFWIEMAELHDGQRWWHRNLQAALDALPCLSAAPVLAQDEAFFAGLATLLTAGDGLGWHRVLIFQCDSATADSADLVYALGGLGGHEHFARWDSVERKYRGRLEQMIRDRYTRPAPSGPDPAGEETLDPLYRQCVAQPRAVGKPIRILWREGAGGGSNDAAVLATGLLHVRGREFDPLDWRTLYLKKEPWLVELEKRYPGMFVTDWTYAFPLWSSPERARELLGLVLVDMAYWPGQRPQPTLTATRVLLDIVGHILAARNARQGLSPAPPEFPGDPVGVSRLMGSLSASLAELRCLLDDPNRGDATELSDMQRTRLANVKEEFLKASVSLDNLRLGTPLRPSEAPEQKPRLLIVTRQFDTSNDPALVQTAEAIGFRVHVATTEKDVYQLLDQAQHDGTTYDVALVEAIQPLDCSSLDRHPSVRCARVIRTLRMVHPLCRIIAVEQEAHTAEQLQTAGANEVNSQNYHNGESPEENDIWLKVLTDRLEFWRRVVMRNRSPVQIGDDPSAAEVR